MKQDFRSYALVKAAALLLAVACGVGAVFGWGYTLLNWDALFNGGDYTATQAWYAARNSAFSDLMELLELEGQRQIRPDGRLTYLDQQQYDALCRRLDPENTNFRYTVRDNTTGELLYSSLGEDSLDGVSTVTTALRTLSVSAGDISVTYTSAPESNIYYWFDADTGELLAKVGTDDLPIDPETFDPEAFADELAQSRRTEVQYAIEYGVTDRLAADDAFRQAAESCQAPQTAYVYWAAGLTAAFLVLTVFLMSCAGRRRGCDAFVLNWADRIPYDLYLLPVAVAVIGACAVAVELAEQVYYQSAHRDQFLLLGTAAALGVGFALALWALMSTATRCKTHTLLRGTLTWRLCAWCLRGLKWLWAALREGVSRLMSHLPLAAEAALGATGYLLVNTFLTAAMFHSYRRGGAFLLLFLLNGTLLALVLRWSLAWADLRRATQAIVSGHPETAVDTSRMKGLPALRQHAQQLGDLGGAIDSAVKEQLKSERMKAELITNVSHDLKTPLTSIINYVDLLKKEDIQGEKAREYIEVLDRKSQILKKLTEDLVEASKASTGALPVNAQRLGVVQLITQALGEYSEKFAAAGLTPVANLAQEELYICADGRHLWRILDNLLGNCVKYAMAGTRVYLDLTAWEGQVIFSVKNISAQQLNVPPEQLMERFVRGDESRTTEGSGLGLSIARSLTELQGGAFRLEVDGDLFKAVVAFPQAE